MDQLIPHRRLVFLIDILIEDLQNQFPMDQSDVEIVKEKIERNFPVDMPEVKIYVLPDNTDRIYLEEIDATIVQILSSIKRTNILGFPVEYYQFKSNPLFEYISIAMIKQYIDFYDQPQTPPMILSDETGEFLLYESGTWGILYTAPRVLDFTNPPPMLYEVLEAYVEWKYLEYLLNKRQGSKLHMSQKLFEGSTKKGLEGIDSTIPPIKSIGLSGISITFDDRNYSSIARDLLGRDEVYNDLVNVLRKKRKKFLIKKQNYYGPVPIK